MVEVTTPPAPPARDDARTAKAEAKAAKARAKALRPWYRKKRYILTLAIVAIVGMAVAGSSGGGEQPESAAATEQSTDAADTFSSNSDNPPQNDVTVTGCAVDEIGWMEATVDVVNNSSKQSNYMIEITFESADQSQQFGTGAAFINNLEPGQKKAETISAVAEAPGEFTCRITDVNRLAA